MHDDLAIMTATQWDLSLDHRKIAEMILRLQGMMASQQATDSNIMLK
jgi:hypothetical protein